MRTVATMLTCLLLIGCEWRSATGALWDSGTEVYIIYGNQVSSAKKKRLIGQVGDNVKYDAKSDRFFIRANAAEKVAGTTAKVLITPITVVVDAVSFTAVAIIAEPAAFLSTFQ